jgi:hypothetical protein
MTKEMKEHIKSLGDNFKQEDLPDFIRLYDLRKELKDIDQKRK